jgi:hypothetical protein
MPMFPRLGPTGQTWYSDRPTIDRPTREKAYFLWEERVRLGVPGGALWDWVVAKQWVSESFPWLSDKLYWSGIVHQMPYDEQIDSFTCPSCCLLLGDKENPPPSQRFSCVRCGVMLEVVDAPKPIPESG